METIKLGLQIHAVREDFAENYQETFRRVAEMGYEGIELNLWTAGEDPKVYAQELKQNGLECLGCMFLAKHFAEDALQKVISACKDLGYSGWRSLCQKAWHQRHHYTHGLFAG